MEGSSSFFSPNFVGSLVDMVLPNAQVPSKTAEEEHPLKKKVNEFAAKMGLGNKQVDLKIIDGKSNRGTFASGSTWGKAHPAVYLNPKDHSEASIPFFLAHEVAHIKHNHAVKSLGVLAGAAGIAAIVTAVAIGILFPPALVGMAGMVAIVGAAALVGRMAFVGTMRNYEREADVEAFKLCSPAEQKAAIAQFEQYQARVDEKRAKETGTFDKVKHFLQDINETHPTWKARAEYLRQVQAETSNT